MVSGLNIRNKIKIIINYHKFFEWRENMSLQILDIFLTNQLTYCIFNEIIHTDVIIKLNFQAVNIITCMMANFLFSLHLVFIYLLYILSSDLYQFGKNKYFNFL